MLPQEVATCRERLSHLFCLNCTCQTITGIMKVITIQRVFILVLSVACLLSCHPEEKPLTPAEPGYLHKMIPYTNDQKLVFANKNHDTIRVTIEYSCVGCNNGDLSGGWNYYFKLPDGNSLARIFIRYDIANVVDLRFYSTFTNGTGTRHIYIRTKDNVPEFDCDQQTRICHDSFDLNGKSYNDVLEISDCFQCADRVYYTKEKGLLAFDFYNGSPYYLMD
jgi:hypothetical protein